MFQSKLYFSCSLCFWQSGIAERCKPGSVHLPICIFDNYYLHTSDRCTKITVRWNICWYSNNFCWLEQQYWQFTAATFMNFSCTLDMIRKSSKFLDRFRTHTRFFSKTYRLRPLGHPSSLLLHAKNTIYKIWEVWIQYSEHFVNISWKEVHPKYVLTTA